MPVSTSAEENEAITICRFAEGRIAEEWVNWDNLGLMQQLGVIPA